MAQARMQAWAQSQARQVCSIALGRGYGVAAGQQVGGASWRAGGVYFGRYQRDFKVRSIHQMHVVAVGGLATSVHS